MPRSPTALHEQQSILNGKYRILRLIGEGGMARVWLAEELTFGRRQVALKEPKANPLTDTLTEAQVRYRREVEVGTTLEQAGVPNIVRAITAEPLDGSVLLAMVYMPGGDLADLLRQHPQGLPVERAVAIALDVLAALAGAHSHPLEIVHRDVKPSNILFDAAGKAHLADFGLAQLAGVSGRSQLSGGHHPGTPAYMAPEQETSMGYLSPAADLFALGCVLWEMLTGKRYKRFKPGTPPSLERASSPSWLDDITMKALAEIPWNRWQSAGDMAKALRSGQAAEQQSQQAAAARRQAEKQARREAERRAHAEAAERTRQAEETHGRQQQLAVWYAEAERVAGQQPAQALALVEQIRSADPAYPGLADVERRARKAQASARGFGRGRSAWLAWVALGTVLVAAAAVIGIMWHNSGGEIAPRSSGTALPARPTPAFSTVTPLSTVILLLPTDEPTPFFTSSPSAQSPVQPVGSTFGYVVKSGDTLFSIALNYNTDVETVRRLNNLPDDSIQVGQVLIVPGTGDVQPGAAPGAPLPTPTPAFVVYAVRADDSLAGIAARFNVAWQDIAAANNIAGPNYNIFRGQKLVIPGVVATPVPTAEPRQHIVQSGETIGSIAVQYGVTVQAILNANGLASPDGIRVGQVLTIP